MTVEKEYSFIKIANVQELCGQYAREDDNAKEILCIHFERIQNLSKHYAFRANGSHYIYATSSS